MERLRQEFKEEIKIISMMRVKNEERWLEESIRSMAPLVDKIIILDDGSSDQTPEICFSYPELVEYHYQEEQIIDEARDKNALLRWVLRYDPDWVLALDGDEVLEEIAPATIIREIGLLDPADPQFTVYSFHFLYMWNKPDYFRAEPGIYSNFWQPRLFTLRGQNLPNLQFKPTAHGANFHCGSIPRNLRVISRKLDVKVKHYGYFDPARRQEKYNWYCRHDPEQAARGYYEHLTSEEGMVLARWRERGEASSASFVKDIPYYQSERAEIIDLVPGNAGRILDVGCGFGFLGGRLKERDPAPCVCGIELDTAAACAAEEMLDQVITGSIEEISLPFKRQSFDCVIMADILEHLRDPWQVLLKLREYLTSDGLLLISIPNVRNLEIVEKLINGEWRYCQAGILDATHLRFFTLKEMKKTLAELGYRVTGVTMLEDPGIDTLQLNEGDRLREVGASFEWGNLDQQTVEELHAVQFLLQVRRKERLKQASRNELTSIIIPVHNNLNKTRLCIESILSYTPEPRELIIIDNGSFAEIGKYLDSLTALENVVLIRNSENLGYPRACNQGIVNARGRQLVFLNNDVLVGDSWLSNLLEHLEKEDETGEPGVGIVGACSNYVAGPQLVTPPYRELDGFYQFTREYYWEHHGEYLLTYRLGGFCLLVKRQVVEEIGGFDERFSPGNYEDDDLCLRAAAAGFKVIVACDVFLHHFGSSTFGKHGRKYQDILAANWEKFKAKWGLDPRLKSPEEINYPLVIAENNQEKKYYLSPEQHS